MTKHLPSIWEALDVSLDMQIKRNSVHIVYTTVLFAYIVKMKNFMSFLKQEKRKKVKY